MDHLKANCDKMHIINPKSELWLINQRRRLNRIIEKTEKKSKKKDRGGEINRNHIK